MEVIVITGKRENSKHFAVSELDAIYSLRSKDNGKIGSDGLFYASDGKFGTHTSHNFTTTSVINFLACFNEMKEQARTSGKLPNVVYDEVMAK